MTPKGAAVLTTFLIVYRLARKFARMWSRISTRTSSMLYVAPITTIGDIIEHQRSCPLMSYQWWYARKLAAIFLTVNILSTNQKRRINRSLTVHPNSTLSVSVSSVRKRCSVLSCMVKTCLTPWRFQTIWRITSRRRLRAVSKIKWWEDRKRSSNKRSKRWRKLTQLGASSSMSKNSKNVRRECRRIPISEIKS